MILNQFSSNLSIYKIPLAVLHPYLPSGSALSDLFSRTLFNPYSARIRSVRNIFSHYLTSFIIRLDPLHPKIFSHASFLPSLSLPHGSIGSAFSTLPISSDFSYSFRIAVPYVPLSHPHVLLVSPHDLFS